MKAFRLHTVLLMVVLVCGFGLTLAQDTPSVAELTADGPAFAPPSVPLNDCATAGETEPCDMIATQPEDIIGVWRVYFFAEPAYIRFKDDGTWTSADTIENTVQASVEGFPYGLYSFDENGVYTTSSAELLADLGLPEECLGARHIVRVFKVVDQPVALDLALLEDCFALRRTDYEYAMLWVSGE
jgi:hypothetical protein